MASVIQNNFRVRKNYAKITKIIDIPNLIDIQKQSYEKFLQKDIPQDQREDVGLQGVFKSVFPIKDFSETSSLEFVSYNLDKPKYDVDECRQRGMTFAAPIKVVIRLVVWDTNEETGSQSIRDVKEQEVYFGEIPLMTENGTFIINGTERVVVSQLHRSPGVFYDHDKGKTHSSGKLLYSRPRDSVPRLVARLRVRPEGHPPRPHRPSPQAARDGAPARARLLDGRAAQLLLLDRDDLSSSRARSTRSRSSTTCSRASARRATSVIRIRAKILVKKNRKFTKQAIKKLQDCEDQSAARRSRRKSSARSRRTTSSTRTPAKSSCSATRK